MAQKTTTKSNGHEKAGAQAAMRSSRGEHSPNREMSVNHSGPGGNLPIALEASVRRENALALNQILADSITLRDLYKKHHWQVAGPTFYPLHLLFDKHFEEQVDLVDEIAERIRILGGISVAMGGDVAELTKIPRPPLGIESPEQQIMRLLEAHEIILVGAHAAADAADESGDHGTNDLLSSKVIPKNELEAWFVGQHLADADVRRE